MATDLLSPVLEGGIRNINFFNGRVLTAEDMEQEQAAHRRKRRQLGRALGEGVAEGLEVRLPSTPAPHVTVVVSPGVAINRRGEILSLSEEVTVAIVPEDELKPPEEGLFAECQPGTGVPSGVGPYVLAVTPASALKERAPKVGLKDNGVAASCGRRFVVEGVKFKLIPIDLQSDSLIPQELRAEARSLASQSNPSAAQRALLQNLLAHLCLGTVEAGRFSSDLFDGLGREPSALAYGPLDKLRPTDATPEGAIRLTDCDVPLALFFWATDRIRILDMWAVRRRLHRRATSFSPPYPVLDRRRAEAEAAFMQFQAHLRDLLKLPAGALDLSAVKARGLFRFLPAAGVLPITDFGAASGFNPIVVFSEQTTREPVYVEGARAPYLLQVSFSFPPIDLDSGEMFWQYWVRENIQTITAGTTPAPQPLLCVANGHMPFLGEPRYDLSRWDFSNYF